MHLVVSPVLTFHMTTDFVTQVSLSLSQACVFFSFYKHHVNNLMYHSSVHLVEWNNWLVVLRGY